MSQVGYEKSIQIKTTVGSTWGALSANTSSLTLGAELLEDTDFISTGWRSRAQGLRDWNVTATIFWDASNTTLTLLRNSFLNATRIDVRYLPDGSNGYQGTAFIENFTNSGEVGGLETVDVSLQPATAAMTTV
jgi:hypothetical protein